jgi:hypothetical protein
MALLLLPGSLYSVQLPHFTITASLMLVGDCGASRVIANYSLCTKEHEDAPPACTRVAALQHLVTRITRLDFAHHADPATDATATR